MGHAVMGLLSSLLALLFPAPQAGEPPRAPQTGLPETALSVAPVAVGGLDGAEGASWQLVAEGFQAPVEQQVRIEQRMTIRITPRAAPIAGFVAEPQRDATPRLVERRMGKCLPVAGIAGVQAGGGSRLILFMRDRRVVSASLERACQARDFYSGFYLERSADGRLCVDRDTLLSRSGANCRVTRLRQLVEDED